MTIWGIHPIAEALKTRPTGAVLLVEGRGPRIDALVTAARSANVAVEPVSRPQLRARTGDPAARGVALELPAAYLARRDEHRAGRFALFAAEFAATPVRSGLVLVLNGVTDPHNFGAILRSADQFAADLVVVATHNSAHRAETVTRAAAGADESVPLAVVPNLSTAVERLKALGFWVYGADATGESPASSPFQPRSVLVMGSEDRGIRQRLTDHCDRLVAIPTRGHIDSLNVSVAAAILLYEYRRVHGFAPAADSR